MDLVGYRLKNIETEEYVGQWGGAFNSLPPLPPFIQLPNGDQVWAPTVGGEYQGYLLEEWYMEAPPAPLPPIPVISDRQFFQQAAIAGFITPAEALAAVQTGTIPAVLQALIDGIEDENEKFGATMVLAGATTFDRNHPLTEAVRLYLNKTSEEIDQFFRDASLL